MAYLDKISVFDRIEVTPVEISASRISGDISVVKRGVAETFRLIFTYHDAVRVDENLAGMILTMPAINFTLFSRSLVLNFPVSKLDFETVKHFTRVNNTEVFVNRLCRRRHEFFRKEVLPKDSDITESNAAGNTEIIARKPSDTAVSVETDQSRVSVLSSGGKESLLSYGMLRELGYDPFALFFNESGGHWLTARTAYKYYSENFSRVEKVWSNVDRFYHFMLSKMDILDPVTSKKRSDDYPVQLFIFPVYIFSMIPLIQKHKIGNIVLGDEFDDPREVSPYKGIGHYFGVYDQTADFNRYISQYFEKKGIGTRVWSSVYPISGFLVERILMKRYPDLFETQRSCHSCHISNGKILPCGTCSKCLGIQLFILGSGGDPERIGYRKVDPSTFEDMIRKGRVRLDPDEFEYPNRKFLGEQIPENLYHVSGIHILPEEKESFSLIPQPFRNGIRDIISSESSGYFRLQSGAWVRAT
ncbi:MAG: metal-binding protein [Thermoplasmataceae archaeon]